MRVPLILLALLPLCVSAPAQVVEFWSNGLEYQALSRGGLTIMYARLPLAIHDYGIVQAAVSNGSGRVWKLKPADFVFEQTGDPPLRAIPEAEVIYDLFRNAGRNEVIKLQSAYEQALFGNQHIRSNNGYEQRRLAALAMGDKGVRAAAAASALAFATTELSSGDSTDGALFFRTSGQELPAGRLVAVIQGQVFEFHTK